MMNLEYICDFYNQNYKKSTKYENSMKLFQYLLKMWTNRPLGLNTNF